MTVELSAQLIACGLDAVPHLAARQITARADLERIISELAIAGVSDVFVVGGDVRAPAGPYASGLELLQDLDAIGHGFSEIGIPAYPEGHPFIDDATVYRMFHEKAAFATYAVTQMCFDAHAISAWLAALRRHGTELPVLLGIPGVVSQRKLARISVKIGVAESSRFVRSNTGVAFRLLRPGGYKPNRLLRDLSMLLPPESGVAGIHLFTFNEVAATYAWFQDRSQRAARPSRPRIPPVAMGDVEANGRDVRAYTGDP